MLANAKVEPFVVGIFLRGHSVAPGVDLGSDTANSCLRNEISDFNCHFLSRFRVLLRFQVRLHVRKDGDFGRHSLGADERDFVSESQDRMQVLMLVPCKRWAGLFAPLDSLFPAGAGVPGHRRGIARLQFFAHAATCLQRDNLEQD